jgi:4-amino-4-deoxy-L-arabinose transferase-like glycosyltransferase
MPADPREGVIKTQVGRKWTWMLGLTGLGVAIRLTFLLLARDIEPYADESNYIYLALMWNRSSVYSGGLPFLWPPGYPFCLATALDLFGLGGLFALKLGQVFLSGVIGLMVMLLADRLFPKPTALLAGWIWCLYLPLIGFTHYLWPETLYLGLFLPGFYLLVCWWQQTPRVSASHGLLVLAGMLFGASLLVKEVGLWWCVLVGVLILYHERKSGPSLALSRAALFLLSVSVIVVPWTLRNFEVYGRFVPVGATLGTNVHLGMNSLYINLDYPGQNQQEIANTNAKIRRWLTAPPERPWKRSNALNVIDQSSENVQRGLQFAKKHPGFILRTRIKRLADWITPLSFFVRHHGLGLYQGFLADPLVRRILLCFALILPVLVLVGTVAGICFCIHHTTVRGLLLWTLLYFALAGSLIAGISRYRISIEPLLIILAAAYLSRSVRPKKRKKAAILCVSGWVLLSALWLINAAEVWVVAKNIW